MCSSPDKSATNTYSNGEVGTADGFQRNFGHSFQGASEVERSQKAGRIYGVDLQSREAKHFYTTCRHGVFQVTVIGFQEV